MNRLNTYRIVSLFILAAVLLGACGTPTPAAVPPTQPVQQQETPTEVAPPTAEPAPKEAPALVELVKAGKLPPLADRLPKTRWLSKLPRFGTYAAPGAWAMRGGTDDPSFYRIITYENLVRWNPAGTRLCQTWPTSGMSTPTPPNTPFHIREGGEVV